MNASLRPGSSLVRHNGAHSFTPQGAISMTTTFKTLDVLTIAATLLWLGALPLMA